MEGEFSGAVKQHKPTPALDYCRPPPQLGLPARSRGPHTRRGRWTQIPTLKDSHTEASATLPLTPHPPAPPRQSRSLTCAGSWTLPAPENLFSFVLFFNCNSCMKAILLRCFPSFFSRNGDAARKPGVCESAVSVNDSNTVPLFDTSVTPPSQASVDVFLV